MRSNCGRPGVAPVMVVTGGKQPGDRFTEAEASANYLIDRGVPAEAILQETVGHSSYASLDGVADPVATARIVQRAAGQRSVPLLALASDRPGARARRLRLTDAYQSGARQSPRPPKSSKKPPESRVGRVIGFKRLLSITGVDSVVPSGLRSTGRPMGNGVIGNTAVSGTVIQGSSPCSPAHRAH